MEHKKTKRGYYEKQLTTSVILDSGNKLRVTGISKISYEDACEQAQKKKEEVERLDRIKVAQDATLSTKQPLKNYIISFIEYKSSNKVSTKLRWEDSSKKTNLEIYESKFAKSKLGSMQLKNLTVKHFQDFFDDLTLEKKLSISYVRNIRLLLIQTFDWINNNIMTIENYPKLANLNEKKIDIDLSYSGDDVIQEKGQVLSKEDCEKILQAARDNYYRYGYVYALLLSTGMRPGEALALTVQDIDFSKREIVICKAVSIRRVGNSKKKEPYLKTTKNKIIRKMYMDTISEEAIRGLIRRMPQGLDKNFDDTYQKQGLLIYNTKGNLLSVSDLTSEFKRLCFKYSINLEFQEGIYCLRHTFVSYNNAFYTRNPILEAAKVTSLVVGHSVETDIGTYTHVDTQTLASIVKNPISMSMNQEMEEEKMEQEKEYQLFLEFLKFKKMMEEKESREVNKENQ